MIPDFNKMQMQISRMCLSWWLQKSSASLDSTGGHLTLLLSMATRIGSAGASLAMCEATWGYPYGGS